MTNGKPRSAAPFLRIAIMLAIVLCAANLRQQPSAALPLEEKRLAHSSQALHPVSLFEQLRAEQRIGALPHRATVNDSHAMLTTPKIVPVSALLEANFESLTIRTEIQTHRIFSSMPTTIQFAPAMAAGTRTIVQRGQPAITVVTERVTLWNDIAVDRHPLSRIIVQRAQPRIIVAAAPRSLTEAMALSGVHKPVAAFIMMATAYTATSAQGTPNGRTATGMLARYGVVAVDPRIIRLGSRLFIEGYGTAVAGDTGGAIHGNRIDLCMDSLRSALNWGRQPVRVYVLQE